MHLNNIYYDHVDIVKLLLENGAYVDLIENDGWSSLMVVSQNGNVNAASEYGSKVNLQDGNGWSSLMAVSQNGHVNNYGQLNCF